MAVTHQQSNFVARNWRGEYPLFVSFWVLGLIGNVTIALVPFGLAEILSSESGFQPTYTFAFIFGVWLTSIGIWIWQWVSVWRSASRHIERKSLMHKRAPWAHLAKAATVLAFIQLACVVAGFAIPRMTEAARVAFMNDPDIPDYSIQVTRNGTEAEITGGIKYGMTDDLQKLLHASREIRVVHLNSIGGRIGEGEKLYHLIKDSRLNTYVSAQCLSACTLAFSGGSERVLRHGAVLGFHRASFAGEERADLSEPQARIFTEAGYAAPFIARALATHSNEMWKPSEAELLQSAVITGVSNGSD